MGFFNISEESAKMSIDRDRVGIIVVDYNIHLVTLMPSGNNVIRDNLERKVIEI